MIHLRNLIGSDLKEYQYWKLPHHAYHSLNGPYYEKESPAELELKFQKLRAAFENSSKTVFPKRKLIVNVSNKMIGEVSWYWKSEETKWLEIGIVIFNQSYWGKGIGYEALRLWIDELFATKKELVRLGLTTWSGNMGMLKLAEKLGMKKEATYRKARIVNGQYYDSISYGILKEEWLK